MVLGELLELFKMQHPRRQVGNALDAKIAILMELFKLQRSRRQVGNHVLARYEIHCGTDTYSRRS